MQVAIGKSICFIHLHQHKHIFYFSVAKSAKNGGERQIEVILFRGLFRKFPTQVTISAWSESGFYLNFPFCSFIQHNKQEIETQIQGRTKHAEEVNLFWGNLSKQLFFSKA